MPQSRKRRPKNTRPDRLRRRRRDQPRFAGRKLVATLQPGEDLTPYLTPEDVANLLAAVDAAARGDIAGAIEHELAGLVVEESLTVPRLRDLACREEVPPWAYSRWCADQAMRWLLVTHDDRVDAATRLTLCATHADHLDEIADDVDALSRYGTLVAAGDWVCHQLAVFEYDGLADFLAARAEAGLVERCDRIREWTRSRMGVYSYERTEGPALVLRDLVAGEEVRALNIGALSERDRDGVLMGRLVPITPAPGSMFESRPIEIDLETAMVAREMLREDPALGWLWALSDGREEGRLRRGFGWGESTFFTSDLTVPPAIGEVEEAPRMKALLRLGHSPEVANAIGVLEVGLIAASVSPDAVTVVAPHVAVALAVPGAMAGARAECVASQWADAWSRLAAAVPDLPAAQCRELAERCRE